MVCNRCIKVVKEGLIRNNIDFKQVGFGFIEFNEKFSNINLLKSVLEKEGFEFVEDYVKSIVSQIKVIIIEDIHHKKNKPLHQNFSDFLSKNLNIGYSQLSKIFSEIEFKTIEQFIIEQKIEKVKELLIYNELSISQISYDLNYSSPQHLSRQFKQVIGLTPTQFKNIGTRRKLDTI